MRRVRLVPLAALLPVFLCGAARASLPAGGAALFSAAPGGQLPGPAPSAAPATPLASPADPWVARMLRAGDPGALFQRALESPAPAPEAEAAPHRPLKPGPAALLSAAVPGGEQMREGKLRGYVMLGIEAGLWFAYQGLHSGGKDREASAERLASASYSVDAYRANAADSGHVDQATIDRRAAQLRDWQLHSPADFWDAIARDPSLIFGWSDYRSSGATPDVPGSSQLYDTYVQRRDDSNRLLQHANTVLSGVILNHIISAFDAFQSARKFQRQLPMGVRMKVNLDPFGGRAALSLVRPLP
ncbi:MAG TPA: hypothetical protein VMS93_02180 [Candidatus Saccharimonadales bacterium]|nr:hypothetical protein [Candidatus Saccharimonadales bacterium]